MPPQMRFRSSRVTRIGQFAAFFEGRLSTALSGCSSPDGPTRT
jgi:hypothetical protein